MDVNTVLPNGKIPDGLLGKILAEFTGSQGERVILGPKLGEDAGIIDMSHAVTEFDNCLVAAVDPLTVKLHNLPYFAVACNVNDVATRGAIPQWATACVFLPEGSTIAQVISFFREIYEAISLYDISIVSGHTEITSTVINPGIVMTMFGEVKRSNVITTSGANTIFN